MMYFAPAQYSKEMCELRPRRHELNVKSPTLKPPERSADTGLKLEDSNETASHRKLLEERRGSP